MELIDKKLLVQVVKMAIFEDIGDEDVTTAVAVSDNIMAVGKIVSKENIVVAGIPVVKEVFKQIDRELKINVKLDDGSIAKKDDVILEIHGRAKGILEGERLALNFLQRMSGIATMTSKFVKEVEGTDVIILDTRKTTPLLRFLEKYSVEVGGGTNHRFGLFDQFLFKDNHLAASALNFEADIKIIVEKARKFDKNLTVEVEVDNLDQLEKVLKAEPDVILLDNFSVDDLKKAVRIADNKVFLEASGGIKLENVREIAQTGVDAVSVGALTHSVKSADISLDLELCKTKK